MSPTQTEKELLSEVRRLQQQIYQIGMERTGHGKAYQSGLSESSKKVRSPVVVSTSEQQIDLPQIINDAWVRSGLSYTRWLGEYVNGTVQLYGAYSLQESKPEPCESCRMRDLACVEISLLDLVNDELPKDSCCGWCISGSGTEGSEDQRRQRDEAVSRQKNFEIAKAADLATMIGDKKSLLPEPDSRRRFVQNILFGMTVSRSPRSKKFLDGRFAVDVYSFIQH